MEFGVYKVGEGESNRLCVMALLFVVVKGGGAGYTRRSFSPLTCLKIEYPIWVYGMFRFRWDCRIPQTALQMKKDQ